MNDRYFSDVPLFLHYTLSFYIICEIYHIFPATGGPMFYEKECFRDPC
jgi:hypothetical protein